MCFIQTTILNYYDIKPVRESQLAPLAQSAERQSHNPNLKSQLKVVSSILTGGSFFPLQGSDNPGRDSGSIV